LIGCDCLSDVDDEEGWEDQPVPEEDLAKLCASTNYDWLMLWKFFSDDEIKWFKKPCT